MKTRSRVLLMGSMLAGVVALGCQAPPQPTAKQPRVRVTTSTIGVDPNADLALQFKRADCEDQATYGLKQAGPDLDSRVDYFEVIVRDQHGVVVLKETITRSQFEPGVCAKTFNLSELPLGTYMVELKGYGPANGRNPNPPISQDSTPVTILENQTVVAPLECDFRSGMLAVNIKCCPVTPSPSSTPAPTPTPTPPAVDPSSLISEVIGFDVDQQGDIFLAGIDLIQSTSLNNHGRIVRVRANQAPATYPGWNLDPDIFWDEMYPTHDLELINGMAIFSNTFEPGSSVFHTRYLNTAVSPTLPTTSRQRFERTPLWPNTVSHNVTADPRAIGLGNDPRSAIWNFISSGDRYHVVFPVTENSGTTNNYLFWEGPTTDPTNTQGWSPASSVFRAVNDPIWTCKRGLVKLGANRDVYPTIYDETRASGHAEGTYYGLAPANSGNYFVTFLNDRKIYKWNAASESVFTPMRPDLIFDGSYPRLIHLGDDGYYYVLTYPDGNVQPGATRIVDTNVHSSKSFKIMRFAIDSTTGDLTYLDTPVATP